jgi:hypothetical protein
MTNRNEQGSWRRWLNGHIVALDYSATAPSCAFIKHKNFEASTLPLFDKSIR